MNKKRLSQRTVFIIAMLLVSLVVQIFPQPVSADDSDWITLHIDEVSLSPQNNSGDLDGQAEFRIYVFVKTGDGYQAAYTYPHDDAIPLDRDGIVKEVPLGNGGISISAPPSLSHIEIEVLAVDIDELKLDGYVDRLFDELDRRLVGDESNDTIAFKFLDEVVLNAVSAGSQTDDKLALSKIAGQVADFVATVRALTVSRTSMKKAIGRASMGFGGSFLYAYISQADTLQQAKLTLSRTSTGQWQAKIIEGEERQLPFEIDVRISKASDRIDVVQSSASTSKVSSSELTLYVGPGIDYPIAGFMPIDAEVSIIESSGDWSHVFSPGLYDGWVLSQYISNRQVQAGNSEPAPSSVEPPSPVEPSKPQVDYSDLANQLIECMEASDEKNDYPYEARLFASNLVKHESVIPFLQGDQHVCARTKALVHRVRKDWIPWEDAGVKFLKEDPGPHISQYPFRQLVIRIVQGSQGPLSEQEQRALESFYTRSWTGDMKGMIGAIHREIYNR